MSELQPRVGDRERDATVLRLRDQCAAGRLSVEDLDERVGRAYLAATRDELDELLSDLPLRSAEQPVSTGRRLFWPGIAPFNELRWLSSSCAESYDSALREIVPRMGTQGYHLVDELRPRRMRFVGDQGVAVTVMFHPSDDGGTDVSAFGHGPRAIRKAFATLSD